MTVSILIGDVRETLATLPAESVQCIVTSPPYYGLRDYGVDGQIGLEPTPEEYVAEMVAVFREARRVLRADGVAWVNLGDSYAGTGATGGGADGARRGADGYGGASPNGKGTWRSPKEWGLKVKDLIGIPWRVAFALQADGWWLRSECIWAKPNPMPESVTDRPTKAHEQVFMLTRSARYFYDAVAVAEPVEVSTVERLSQATLDQQAGSARANGGAKTNGAMKAVGGKETRNRRTVWTIATQPFSGAHFATMPPDLAEICIKAGSRPGEKVLDPFGGAGTTGLVADRLRRNAILCELNPAYAEIARERINGEGGLFAAAE
jgi:DNA modification methylase